MKYCIVFPWMHFIDPIEFGPIKLTYVGDSLEASDRFEKHFIEHLPYVTLEHYPHTCLNYSIAFFEDDKDLDVVLSKYYPYLLLLRFLILTDEYSPSYRNTEYFFFRFENDTLPEGAIHFVMLLNGLDTWHSFTLKSGSLFDRDEPPSHLWEGGNHRIYFDAYSRLSQEEKHRVENGISRYISAHVPYRHADEYSKILNYASGIEGFLDMQKNQGSAEFGRQLKEKFGFPKLQDWGKQLYSLANDFRHQNFSTIQILRADSTERKRLFYNNSDESILHAGHVPIAQEVLKELILAQLFRRDPYIGNFEDMIYSNEIPIKEIVTLIDLGTPFGPEYYRLVDRVVFNKLGGTAPQMKKIIIFICDSLYAIYPEFDIFNATKLEFDNFNGLLNQMDEVHMTIQTTRRKIPISVRNLDRLNLLSKAENLFHNIYVSFLILIRK